MRPLLKFWIVSTVVLFLLTLWPLSGGSSGHTSGGNSLGTLAREAELVDYFCLSKMPPVGVASIPKEWEKVLEAAVKVRETAGEAANDIGLPRENAERITSLKAGEGYAHADKGRQHYVLRSGQGKGWFLVLSKRSPGGGILPSNGDSKPSGIAMAIALALIGGGLMTLLAKVALLKSEPAK